MGKRRVYVIGPQLHAHRAQTKDEGRLGTRHVINMSRINPHFVFLDESFNLVRHALGKVMYAENVSFTLKPRTGKVAVLK